MRPWLISLYFLNLIHAADVTPDRIRSSAAKGVAVIQQSQKNWYAKQNCYSCHEQLLPALTFRAARDHGIPLDEAAARADAVKAFSFYSNLDPTMNDASGLIGAEAAGVLLDAGAKADETDDDGVTLLGWAVIANRVDMARLLIQRGADVNHLDKNGMTPLLYAASIDFGGSRSSTSC